jgi:glyoxylase-like metal-dependent hydrolase (beta-lactamase superfamily II)
MTAIDQEIATGTGIARLGLEASPPESLPFAPSLEIRWFRLQHDSGDIAIYSNRTTPIDTARQYLNHGHEAMFLPQERTAQLFVHERDRDAVPGEVRGTFSRRHVFEDELEVIPTPGHTPGATAYLWDRGDHRVLFTGDTIYLRDGEWVAAVLDSSDRAAYVESLELMRELDFDVLVPWAATRGEPYYALTNREDARERIDRIIAAIRSDAR